MKQMEDVMAGSTELIRSLLKDVQLGGAVVIPKKKLLWLLGWAQDRPGAWTDLLVHWREVESQLPLKGIEIGDKIVLAVPPFGKLEEVSLWARVKTNDA